MTAPGLKSPFESFSRTQRIPDPAFEEADVEQYMEQALSQAEVEGGIQRERVTHQQLWVP